MVKVALLVCINSVQMIVFIIIIFLRIDRSNFTENESDGVGEARYTSCSLSSHSGDNDCKPILIDSSSDESEHEASVAQSSAPSTSSSTCSVGHKIGYCKSWEREYPWLIATSGGLGILCSLCKRHNTCNKRMAR